MNRDEHLFIKLMEECAEVQQRVSKLLQFGPKETEPGQALGNLTRLRFEINDLQAVVTLLEEELLIYTPSQSEIDSHLFHKREKIAKYLAYSKELGTVVDI